MSGHDYLENIKGCRQKVDDLRATSPVPPYLLLPAGEVHPPLLDCPSAWSDTHAICTYAGYALSQMLPPAEVAPYMVKFVSAVHAVHHHPIVRISNVGLMLDGPTMTISIAVPLETL